jgi:hypothetical protein
VALNDDCSAQDRCTEPKLVWLEASGHKDFGYVKKNYDILVNRTARQSAKGPSA